MHIGLHSPSTPSIRAKHCMFTEACAACGSKMPASQPTNSHTTSATLQLGATKSTTHHRLVQDAVEDDLVRGAPEGREACRQPLGGKSAHPGDRQLKMSVHQTLKGKHQQGGKPAGAGHRSGQSSHLQGVPVPCHPRRRCSQTQPRTACLLRLPSSWKPEAMASQTQLTRQQDAGDGAFDPGTRLSNIHHNQPTSCMTRVGASPDSRM